MHGHRLLSVTMQSGGITYLMQLFIAFYLPQLVVNTLHSLSRMSYMFQAHQEYFKTFLMQLFDAFCLP